MTIFSRHPIDNPVITQAFGQANTWEDPPWHKGIDYAGSTSTAIKAPCDGFIVHAGGAPFGYGNTWEQIPGSTNSGNCVILQPLPPHTAANTSFSHLSKITVEHGQYVKAGDVIGYMGSTGFSFGVHLHWELFIDYAEGVYPPGTFYGRVNPLDYFTTATVVPIGTGGKGSAATIPVEEDDMSATDVSRILADIATVHETAIAARNEATNAKNNGQKAADIAQVAANEATNAKVVALDARAATTRLEVAVAELATNPGITPEVLREAMGKITITLSSEGA